MRGGLNLCEPITEERAPPFIHKKAKSNRGITPKEKRGEFDIVQAEIARRKKLGSSYSGNDIFSSKILCADCGGFYGSKLWLSKDNICVQFINAIISSRMQRNVKLRI